MKKLAVITGAGSGIGKALALELALKHNLNVLGIGRDLPKLEATQADAPESIYVLQADVSTTEGREKIALRAGSFPAVDFLVHNAAVLVPVISLTDITLTDWRNHQQINAEAPLFLTQILLPKLKGGRVLHISSGAAHHAYMGWGAYCTSKAALYMIWQVLREELKAKKIVIGSVRPGVVDTPMQDKVREAEKDVFPSLNKFLELKKKNQLLSAGEAARFIANILLNTSDEAFSEKEWDIHSDWKL